MFFDDKRELNMFFDHKRTLSREKHVKRRLKMGCFISKSTRPQKVNKTHISMKTRISNHTSHHRSIYTTNYIYDDQNNYRTSRGGLETK
jgi:hypothetical protein